jgi:hypothetical protein
LTRISREILEHCAPLLTPEVACCLLPSHSLGIADLEERRHRSLRRRQPCVFQTLEQLHEPPGAAQARELVLTEHSDRPGTPGSYCPKVYIRVFEIGEDLSTLLGAIDV